ncbi:protein flightless-1-like [Anopheles nili]|uniref:protein flightless-1-like n=1 Tax=Anopheles nili TaxID=185578 RepID=UPI00237B5F54|nr:protein flightless-1-like [Anopheles nili]
MGAFWVTAILVGVVTIHSSTYTLGNPVLIQRSNETETKMYFYNYFRTISMNQTNQCSYKNISEPIVTLHSYYKYSAKVAADYQPVLNFNQSIMREFRFEGLNDTQNMRTELTIEPNNLIVLYLINAGLERFELAWSDEEIDCRLTKLILHRNRLNTVPKGMDRLRALEILDMSYNKLELFDMAILSKAAWLKVLNLKNNRITTFVSSTSIHFNDLFVVDLSDNQLSILHLLNWNMPRLEFLNIGNNPNFSKLEQKRFNTLPLMQLCYISKVRYDYDVISHVNFVTKF